MTGFDTFYRSRRDDVARALALTLRNATLGSEAADEAMVRALERWGSVERMGNPSGWVYRVGLNWARSRLRRRDRETLGDPPDIERFMPAADLDVARALAELPVTHRAVVVLRYFMDWSLEDIAAGLKIPVGTVKSRLNRAHAKLAELLEVDHETR
jgi:RNA polymerase sigma factor (sigma-70 family)